MRSHGPLLGPVTPGASRSVDAVVVPAARPARHLKAAADLARRLDAQLVTLCGQDVRAQEALVCCPGRAEAVDLPEGYHHPWLDLATLRAAEPANARLGDLSTKRNVALLLGRLAGWRTVLLLDDDILDVPASALRRASRHLGRARAVGLVVSDFPDNSVLGHAHRLAGDHQDVFVSGSALLVDVTGPLTFFPRVYNEDWLFSLDSIWDGRLARSGRVRQLAYDPFADPARAEGEEFGDLLAEGLMWLTHRTPTDRRAVLAEAGEAECWRRMRQWRLADIADVAARIGARRAGEAHPDALAALDAARERATAVTPSSLAAYVRTWRADVARWSERLDRLPRSGSLHQALRRLDLVSHTRSPIRRRIAHDPDVEPGGTVAGTNQVSRPEARPGPPHAPFFTPG